MIITGTIAVLWGGDSPERAVSSRSADSVCTALQTLGYMFERVELNPGWVEALVHLKPRFAFIAAHGGIGENGTVQAVLDALHIPYNGSGVLASSVAMHKQTAKAVFAAAGLDVARGVLYPPADIPASAPFLPCVAKPVDGGSSIDVHIIKTAEHWKTAATLMRTSSSDVLVEEFIDGRELTVGVLGHGSGAKPLGVIEVIPQFDTFYDYASKYKAGGSQHILPAKISKSAYLQAQQVALVAHQALGCRGVSRADIRYNEKQNRFVLLEINTLPGFTATSLVPEMAAHEGLDFTALVKWLIEENITLWHQNQPA